jgi:hypothetical protein
VLAGDRFQPEADPGFSGWTTAFLDSGCTTNRNNPDQVVLTISSDFHSDVSWWVQQITAAVSTIRDKYSNVRSIALQPVVGGPGDSLCYQGSDVVRASFNDPFIDAGIDLVLASDDRGQLTAGARPEVRECSDFADALGHLADSAGEYVGNTVGAFYAQPPANRTARGTRQSGAVRAAHNVQPGLQVHHPQSPQWRVKQAARPPFGPTPTFTNPSEKRPAR